LPALCAVVLALPLWLADWPALAQPAGVQGLLRALGILTGVAGTALWVMSLALMLRFPALDRRFGGLERQYFAHHLSGTLAYLMLLAHPALLAAAAWVASPAAAAALAAPWGQPLTVVAGWIALVGLMVMMFATFFSGLPYARWKQLHAAAGVIARVQGPYGALFNQTDFTRPQLWLGGGIGITPFLSMAAALPPAAAGVDLYYLARDAGEAFGLDALRAAAAKNPRLRVFALLANESPQAVRAAVQASSAPLAAREVYLCGPPGMVQAALAWLADAGVPQAQIHAERFDFR
jgi:predicted ferric reductase